MAALMDRQKADSTITMRLPAQTRELIDRAAATVDKTRTEFVLESARERAVDVLLDQRVFNLDDAASEAFARALEDPPAPVEALRALMKTKAPWE
jgi:uncharacterized protein (DUF1778 family)